MYDAPYMGTPSGRAPAGGTGPDMVRAFAEKHRGGSKAEEKPGKDIVARRHDIWTKNEIAWKWLLDSYVSGKRYREATYGMDRKGLPLRNLIRHKREYPDPQQFPNTYQGFGATGSIMASTAGINVGPYPGMLGAHQTATAWDDDYEYRRARTPIPEFVLEAIEIHLGKIYSQNISRVGPPDLMDWWGDVDNAGTPADEWFEQKFSPLLLALGCLDVVCDRPAPPPGVQVDNERHVQDYGLDRCVAAIILPQNMVWWRNDPAEDYLECLVREFESAGAAPNSTDDSSAVNELETAGGGSQAFPHALERFRHWTADGWTLYSSDGDILGEGKHNYGRPPIRRFYDIKIMDEMLGKSRYESTAENQMEFYNRDSELVLSDTLQAHPILSIPEEFCKAENTISMGPGNLIPMKKIGEKEGYQAPVFISPPKDPSDSLRTNKNDIRDVVDRRNSLTKPAGTPGTTGGTVAQSGISKQLDAHSGEAVLKALAKTLAKAERQMAELVLFCLHQRTPTLDERAAIKVTYANRYQLRSGTDLLNDLLLLGQVIQAIEFVTMAMPGPMEGSDLSPGGQQPAKRPGNGSTGASTQPAAPPPPTIADVQKAITTSRKCPVPTLVGQLLMEAAAALLNNPDTVTREQIREEIAAWVKANRIVQPGVASDNEAFLGAGSDESRGGEDPTGASAATSVSPATPAVAG